MKHKAHLNFFEGPESVEKLTPNYMGQQLFLVFDLFATKLPIRIN